jgi:hypothetical protein
MPTTAATPARFATAIDARTAIFAGNATFTLVSRKSGARFTFKVTQGEEQNGRPAPHFVKLLNGPNNTADYVYAGILDNRGVRTTKASKVSADAPSMVALTWAVQKLAAGVLPETLEVWHEGRCMRCGRVLTVPESVAHGFGPECAEKMAAGE